MEEHEHSINCPMCGAAVSAKTEAELIKKYQAHASAEHDEHPSDDMVRDMMKGKDKPM
jgi:predicted small metal-binding protein